MAKQNLYQEAQKRLIGSLLADGENANRVFELITLEDFEEPDLQLIFQAMLEVAREDEEFGIMAVAKALDAQGNLAKVGGAAQLYSFRSRGEKWRLEASPELYASIVKEYASKHRAKFILDETVKLFEPDSGSSAVSTISDLQGKLNEELYRLSDESTVSEMATTMDDYFTLLKERKKIAEENLEKAEGLQGIPSLLPSLNRYTTGWLPGQLITVGARTGIGKSVFAVNCATAAAKAGKSVLFFSLEMGAVEIQDRIVSSMSSIPLEELKQGKLGAQEEKVLGKTRQDIEDMNILIDTDPKITVDTIRARALRRAQSAVGLDFIIVDYLQLVSPSSRFSSRQEAVADISRNMKLLAKQLQVPIMVLVQVNRESKNDEENPIPKLDQIRESGAIAQDSDIVILLHRDVSMDDSIPHTLVILAKNRNGESNKTIRCHSNLECSLFREVQRSKDVENQVSDEDIAALDSYGADEDLDLGFDEDL